MTLLNLQELWVDALIFAFEIIALSRKYSVQLRRSYEATVINSMPRILYLLTPSYYINSA